MAAKFDPYTHVTDSILAELENGTAPWRKPWTGAGPGFALPERWNGETYRGINILLLWSQATRCGYRAARWMTYRQAQELGAQVRKGEKSATVVKYGTVERATEDGEDRRTIPYLRAYRVFNAEQIDGLDADFYSTAEAPRDLGTEADPALEAVFAATGARIETSPEPRAYYDRAADRIHMPPIATFHAAAGYYGTLAHEVAHWTGAAHRLDRFGRFTTRDAYAFEELIAEIASAFIGARLGVAPDFGQNAAYLASWLDALRADKRAIFRAASEAQKAADFIFALPGVAAPDAAEDGARAA
jgi:antirestriction protein ArdC